MKRFFTAGLLLGLSLQAWAAPVEFDGFTLEVPYLTEAVKAKRSSVEGQLPDKSEYQLLTTVGQKEPMDHDEFKRKMFEWVLPAKSTKNTVEVLEESDVDGLQTFLVKSQCVKDGASHTLYSRAAFWTNGSVTFLSNVSSEVSAPAALYPKLIKSAPPEQLLLESKKLEAFSALKNTATALEMWATDHDGKYPDSLNALYPMYLKGPLVCPVSHSPFLYAVKSKPAGFRLSSPGDPFKLGQGFPAYDSESGLQMQK
jgi:hypothetical protein